MDKTRKYSKSAIFISWKMAANDSLGINALRACWDRPRVLTDANYGQLPTCAKRREPRSDIQLNVHPEKPNERVIDKNAIAVSVGCRYQSVYTGRLSVHFGNSQYLTILFHYLVLFTFGRYANVPAVYPAGSGSESSITHSNFNGRGSISV